MIIGIEHDGGLDGPAVFPGRPAKDGVELLEISPRLPPGLGERPVIVIELVQLIERVLVQDGGFVVDPGKQPGDPLVLFFPGQRRVVVDDQLILESVQDGRPALEARIVRDLGKPDDRRLRVEKLHESGGGIEGAGGCLTGQEDDIVGSADDIALFPAGDGRQVEPVAVLSEEVGLPDGNDHGVGRQPIGRQTDLGSVHPETLLQPPGDEVPGRELGRRRTGRHGQEDLLSGQVDIRPRADRPGCRDDQVGPVVGLVEERLDPFERGEIPAGIGEIDVIDPHRAASFQAQEDPDEEAAVGQVALRERIVQGPGVHPSPGEFLDIVEVREGEALEAVVDVLVDVFIINAVAQPVLVPIIEFQAEIDVLAETGVEPGDGGRDLLQPDIQRKIIIAGDHLDEIAPDSRGGVVDLPDIGRGSG